MLRFTVLPLFHVILHNSQLRCFNQSIRSCFRKIIFSKCLNLTREMLMRLVSKSAAALMPAGSRQVLLAPTHTCTSLPDHVLLTSAKPKSPINYVTCFHVKGHFSLTILYPYILWFNLVCLAEVLFCLRFWIFFPSPWSLCGKVGCSTWMHSTAPHRRRVYLSIRVRSQPVIWGEIRAVWDFKRCGRE